MSLSALVGVRVGQGRRDALFTGGSGGENSSVPTCFSVGACSNHYSQVVVGATVGARRQTLTFCRKEATALRRGVSRSLLPNRSPQLEDATALRRGVSRSLLLNRSPQCEDATALWSFTILATKSAIRNSKRPCAVGSHDLRYCKRELRAFRKKRRC